MLNVVITWSGLPPYAISQLSYFSNKYSSIYNIFVVATLNRYRPTQDDLSTIPSLIIIDSSSSPTFQDLGIPNADILFLSGFRYKAFSRLHNYMLRSSRPVVCMSDSNVSLEFPLSFLRSIYFRSICSHRMSAALVPGREGKLLLRHYGFRKPIRQGMYGCDPSIFSRDISYLSLGIDEIPILSFLLDVLKKIKGFDLLLDCFSKLYNTHPEWKLVVVGDGSLSSLAVNLPNVHLMGYLDKQSIADLMSNSSFFILPSRNEPWGVVVHEAATCGLPLLLSDSVGSAVDLATDQNSIVFSSGDSTNLYQSIIHAIQLPFSWYINASKQSVYLSAQYGPSAFAYSVCSLITQLS